MQMNVSLFVAFIAERAKRSMEHAAGKPAERKATNVPST
jgi:hypothetical protein